MREKRAVEQAKQAPKTSAAERTESIPDPDIELCCTECKERFKLREASKRDNGVIECTACGMPVKIESRASVELAEAKNPSTRVDGFAKRAPKDPDRRFCAECGSEWLFGDDGLPIINCGHVKSERIADPRKARNFAPPAGLQTRAEAVFERLNAEDMKRLAAAPSADLGCDDRGDRGDPTALEKFGRAATAPGPASGNRLSIPWGKARFPYVYPDGTRDKFNAIEVGGHILTIELAPGANAVDVAREMISDLEKIADVLYERQRAWYDKKLSDN